MVSECSEKLIDGVDGWKMEYKEVRTQNVPYMHVKQRFHAKAPYS